MTNATKSLSLLFVVLLVVTVIVSSTSSSSSQAFRSDVVDVDTASVDRLVIQRPAHNGEIILKKKAGRWKVSDGAGSKDYPADGSSVKRAIEQLNHLDVKAVATRDPEKYTRFKVDSTGTRVSLFSGDELMAALVVGAPQIVSRREFNNYVRRAGEDAVYSVSGFLGPTFSRDVNDWRDKSAWQVDQRNISQVDFLFPADSSYSMKRIGPDKWVSNGDSLQSGTVSTLLSRLSSLRVGGFVDSLSVDSFGNERYAVHLQMKDGSQRQLRLKPMQSDSSKFQAVASGFPYVFTLNKSSWKNSVLKPRKKLLKQ